MTTRHILGKFGNPNPRTLSSQNVLATDNEAVTVPL